MLKITCQACFEQFDDTRSLFDIAPESRDTSTCPHCGAVNEIARDVDYELDDDGDEVGVDVVRATRTTP
jgi:rRNA maturation endonuclease Nob1